MRSSHWYGYRPELLGAQHGRSVSPHHRDDTAQRGGKPAAVTVLLTAESGGILPA